MIIVSKQPVYFCKNNAIIAISMANPSPNERAIDIISNNRYFVLSTCDDGGPWAAPLVCIETCNPAGLVFFSSNKSRHAQQIMKSGKVAGAIFNSTLPTADVDGLQFEGNAKKISPLTLPSELPAFSRRYAKKQGKIFDGKLEKMPDLSYRLYKIEITKAWVCDLEAYELFGTDKRVETDVEKVFTSAVKKLDDK